MADYNCVATGLGDDNSQGAGQDAGAGVNLGKNKKCPGLALVALVALARVRDIDHMLIALCPFDRLSSINNSVCHRSR